MKLTHTHTVIPHRPADTYCACSMNSIFSGKEKKTYIMEGGSNTKLVSSCSASRVTQTTKVVYGSSEQSSRVVGVDGSPTDRIERLLRKYKASYALRGGLESFSHFFTAIFTDFANLLLLVTRNVITLDPYSAAGDLQRSG